MPKEGFEAGMPAGGVAANAVVNGGNPVPALTFGGTFPGPYTASIPLDGSSSIGARSDEGSPSSL